MTPGTVLNIGFNVIGFTNALSLVISVVILIKTCCILAFEKSLVALVNVLFAIVLFGLISLCGCILLVNYDVLIGWHIGTVIGYIFGFIDGYLSWK